MLPPWPPWSNPASPLGVVTWGSLRAAAWPRFCPTVTRVTEKEVNTGICPRSLFGWNQLDWARWLH